MKRSAADVLTYLRAHPEGITSRDAWLALGCSRLAARVDDLKRLYGFDIESELVTVASGERSARVARYRLIEGPVQQTLELAS